MCWGCGYDGEMMSPYRNLAEKHLGKESLQRQNSEISIKTGLRGVSCIDKKGMELGRSGLLPLDLQALPPYQRVEYVNIEGFFFLPL